MSRAKELRAGFERGSKSFSLAGRVLSAETRDAAAAVYAFCRRCDDAIDEAPRERAPEGLGRLRRELDRVYAALPDDDPAIAAFQELAKARQIPKEYPAGLLAGMEMDVEGRRYRTVEDLSLYGYRVAGTVGLMMCHVMGVKADAALDPAIALGLALQWTNIARDVDEDWRRGRLYLPDDLLGEPAASRLHEALGGPMPADLVGSVAAATLRLLDVAEQHYRAADEGLRLLGLRDALAIRSARWIYWGIGERVRARGGDPRGGRAVVPLHEKLLLLSRGVLIELAATPRRIFDRRPVRLPSSVASPPSTGGDRARAHRGDPAPVRER
jgi:phytoene synthase